MDNQFRRKTNQNGPLDDAQSERGQSDLIDLYDDVKEPVVGQPDPEVEELKKLAQSDALKAYAWLRYKTAMLIAKIKTGTSRITPRHRKTAKLTAAVIIIGVVGFKLIGAVIDQFGGGKDILGTQTTADFPTLRATASEPTGHAYDDELGVAVFKDRVAGVEVTVSQQQVPDNLKDNPSEVQKLAISLSDKTTINRHETDKGLVYIAQTQNQTNVVIFAHQDLLVFIRSSGLVADQDWISYVNSLQF